MKIACVAIAKDEDRYLEEWINYNLKLGFDDVFVYQNNWRYKYPEKFSGDERVHLIPCDGHRMQKPCYNDFIAQNHYKYDFITCIDIDEFIFVNHRTLKEWLSNPSIVDKECIYLNWRVFGDSNIKLDENEKEFSVLKRFTMCDTNLHRLGKNFINTKLTKDSIIYYNPHIVCRNTNPPKLPMYFDSWGRLFTKAPWNMDNLYIEDVEIFHFRNKTYQECYERKFGTDDVFHEASTCDWKNNKEAFDREFEKHNTNILINTSARDFMYGK